MTNWTTFLLTAFIAASAACSSSPEKTDEAPTETVTTDETVEASETEETSAPDGIKVVAESQNQWTGIAAVDDRIYVNFPRWSEDIPMSVGYLKDGDVVPFPSEDWNSWKPGEDFTDRFVSVQSVVPGPDGKVWVLDTGNPGFQGVVEGAARLFQFDARGNKTEEINFAGSTKPNTYTNDVRFDYEGQRAYVTDSGVGGLIVVDLEMQATYRVLDDHPSTKATDTVLTIDGEKWLRGGEAPKIHADGIAIHDGMLYYQALSGRTLYRIPTFFLDRGEDDRGDKVETLAEVGPSDGLIAGPDGSIYLSSLELNAVRAYRPDGTIEVIAQDALIAWPDSFSWAPDGELLVTTSRIHQSPNPPEPYGVLKIRVD